MCGNAVRLACQDARRQMAARASSILKTDSANLEFKNGKIIVKGEPNKSITIGDLFTNMRLVGKFLEEKGEIIGTATWYQRTTGLTMDTGQIIDLLLSTLMLLLRLKWLWTLRRGRSYSAGLRTPWM